MASRVQTYLLSIFALQIQDRLTIEEWKAKTPLGDVEGGLSAESRPLSESVHPHFTL